MSRQAVFQQQQVGAPAPEKWTAAGVGSIWTASIATLSASAASSVLPTMIQLSPYLESGSQAGGGLVETQSLDATRQFVPAVYSADNAVSRSDALRQCRQ